MSGARRRVAITGVGLVSPLGVGTDATWQGLMDGISGVGPITRFDASDYPCRIAAEVTDFDPEAYLSRKDVKKTDAFIHYAVAAAQFAIEDSGFVIDESNAERVGVIIGSGIGGLPLIERTYETLIERGPSRVSPFFIPGLIVNMPSGQVSIMHGAKGPNSATCTACTTGLHAIGDASRLIQHGYADAMISGGTEGVISRLAVGGFSAMRALSTRNDDPQQASRPWDQDRDGFVIGEGSGILLIEEYESAVARGAHIYAEIVGYGMSGDAHHISAPHPEGDGAARVMIAAMGDAGLDRAEIEYINAHGTSTGLGDAAEVKAVRRVFGEHADRLSMSSTKSSTGHLLGASGGLETGILALAIDRGILPATYNHDSPGEGCDLDFIANQPRQQQIEVGLTNSFGFGGTNGCLVLRRPSS